MFLKVNKHKLLVSFGTYCLYLRIALMIIIKIFHHCLHLITESFSVHFNLSVFLPSMGKPLRVGLDGKCNKQPIRARLRSDWPMDIGERDDDTLSPGLKSSLVNNKCMN